MRWRTVTFTITLITAASLLTACAKREQEGRPASANTEAGSPALAFTLADQDGNSVSLSDHADKIVVLEWTNPDCPFVQRHYAVGTMVRLAGKYQARGVVWLAINSTHYWNREKNKAWQDGRNLPYPILDDHTGRVGRLYGARTTPHMFVVDTAGELVYRGAIDDDPRGDKGVAAVNYVDQVLTEILAGKRPSMSQTEPYGCSVKYAK